MQRRTRLLELTTPPLVTLLLVVCAGCAGLGACGGTTHESPHAYTYVDGAAVVVISAHGIEVRPDATVSYASTQQNQDATGPTSTTKIGGLDFALHADRIVLGEHEFTGLDSGDRVRIGTAGIFVNDERRWDYPVEEPEAAEEAPSGE